LDQEKGGIKTCEYDYNNESAREHHIRYFQTITGMDKIIGEMLQSLVNGGLDKKFIIIFTDIQ